MTSNAKMIDLTIKTLDSQNHKFSVPNTFTILELKEFIASQVNVAVVEQRLIFCGRILSNETKLADIDIDGKVIHLVQKVPRLSTTTSSSSTTTNTTSRSGQNAGPLHREFHLRDPTALLDAIGIHSGLMLDEEESPLLISTRNQGTDNRVSLALDMIRRAHEILNELEHPGPNPPQSSASIAEQFPDGSQQAEASSPSVPPEGVGAPVPQPQTDPDLVDVTYEVDETFQSDEFFHHAGLSSTLMHYVRNHGQANNLFPMHQNATETSAESEVSNVPENVPVEASTNQPPAEQATGTLPSSASSELPIRNYRQTSENRSTAAVNEWQRLRELIAELNKLNEKFRPFYAMYCQLIIDDSQFDPTEGEHETLRAQSIFNGVSEVMHFISHVYHAISDIKVEFTRATQHSFQSRPISHAAHSVTTTTTSEPPSTQQPTSTQTNTTSQSIPSVPAFRLDYEAGSETPNLLTSATETNTNTNMSVNPNPESNNTSTEFPSHIDIEHNVEVVIDLETGSIGVGSIDSEYIYPTAPGATGLPASVSQPQQPSVTIPDSEALPIDSMDHMIDVISNGVVHPFMSEPSVDTTSTQTPSVTPGTTDSSSTINSPSQGLARRLRVSTPRMDPFLPCSSHHFQPNLRPVPRARRSTQGTNRSISSTTSGNLTTDTSSPISLDEVRSFAEQRPSRMTRILRQYASAISGISPTTEGTQSNNTDTTSASNTAQATGQNSILTDALAGQIRFAVDSVFETLEREIDFDRARDLILPPASSSLPGFEQSMNTSTSQSTPHAPSGWLSIPIGEIPYLRNIEGRTLLVDLFLMISRDWTLDDMFSVNLSETSTILTNPVATHIINLIREGIMSYRPPSNQNIANAAT